MHIRGTLLVRTAFSFSPVTVSSCHRSTPPLSPVSKPLSPRRVFLVLGRASGPPEMSSCLEWQLNVKPGTLKEFECMVRRDFRGPGPYPAHCSPSPFLRAIRTPDAKHEQHTHSHPILWSWHTAISPIRDLHSPSGKVIAEVVGRLISHPNGRPAASNSTASHSNVPSLASSMSPVTPPSYEGDSVKIISSDGSNTMQIPGDNVSPPHHHVHARKSSSPIPAHTKTQIPTLHMLNPHATLMSATALQCYRSHPSSQPLHLFSGPIPGPAKKVDIASPAISYILSAPPLHVRVSREDAVKSGHNIIFRPWEMTKVKTQTSLPSTFPIPTGADLSQRRASAAENRFPFGSLVPLWSRQVGLTDMPSLTHC